MPFNYYTLAPPESSASQVLKTDYYALVNANFAIATDKFIIQKETSFGSQVYENIDCRITSVVDSKTGDKKSDDWKQILFNPNGGYTPLMGSLYYFDSNYWVGVFTDNTKSLVNNIIVRRCNEQLRWIGDDGISYSEYCVVDYDITGTRDLVRDDNIILPQGYADIFTQLNERTELIKPNQRFLFGRPKQRVCWRIFGNGIMNSQNQETITDTTARLMTLTVGGYQYNEQVDNLTLGICDYYLQSYSISLTPSSISGNIGEIYPITPTLLVNDIPTSASFTYASSASTVATISASGSVTLIASGSSLATVYMGGNFSVSASLIVTATASGTTTNEIRITPSDNVAILEEDYTDFTAYLYTNGVQQSGSCVFTVADANVSVANYTISLVTANSFRVTNNEMYLEYPLLITTTSGSYTKQISIQLNGAF